ncbi:MAG TPA: GNAT family N-acetyltransferase [Myxococcota bacterium]|nr:GNAT family N-acetyltransferase [Myxococcota bacterium]
MVDVSLRELGRSELREAAHLLGRGMRDNPVNVRAFGPEADRRGRAMARFFEPVVRGLHVRGSILGAFRGATMVGVCGMAPPGRCQPTVAEKLGILPVVVFGNAIGVPLRVLRWTGEWARRDPAQPHWHLGPVAVDPDLQGQGIGRAMLEKFCAHMDEDSALSYLETDKPENVRFYERFGYAMVAEGFVLGVRNWFMMRYP